MTANKLFKNVAPWLLVALLMWAFYRMYESTQPKAAPPLSYSAFLDKVQSKTVESVTFLPGSDQMLAKTKEGQRHLVTLLKQDSGLVGDLRHAGVVIEVLPPPERSMFTEALFAFGPVMLMVAVWIYFMRQQAGNKGGPGGLGSFSKSRARAQSPDENTAVTFADVAGCDEAKEEVRELVDFLKDPTKFQKLGGRSPRGVLLAGPPGTGKTLLAKAIAGEAQVPFFTISGSDFVEMFVGVGAARVRDMFENAKKHKSCILFIDEIDAVGRHRGAGMGGGNDEREQTLNQLLVEMDGFPSENGTIILAATNRPDILDPALLRPGRFDRQVVVGHADVRGREQILLVHMRKIPVGADVRADILARGTPGFSGADLANLVNEAALFAARANKSHVSMSDFEKAKDKVLMGAERHSMRMSDRERSDTAYHEAGHAIVARLLEHTDPVHKVSIVPRGRALGVTLQLPEGDRYSLGKKRILDTIAVLFGGRVAEELYTDDVTTGASNDYERATQMARNMVTRWGMSSKVGPMVVGEADGELFLGRSVQRHENVSPKTLELVDTEARAILEEQYARVTLLLKDNASRMHAMRNALLEWETLDAAQVDDIMADRPVRPPSGGVPPAALPPASGQPTPGLVPAQEAVVRESVV